MLRSMNEQLNYRMEANDGYAGSLSDFLIDDRRWIVRYAVIDTGTWLPGRKVLMARAGMGEPDWTSRSIPILATKAQIEAAPGLSTDRPVSRQYEEFLYEHYAWVPYWAPGVAGAMASPVNPPEGAAPVRKGDPHLRSLREMTGYHVLVDGDKVGRVNDFMCYDDAWEVPFMVVNTGGWFHKHPLMVPTNRVRDISYTDRKMGLGIQHHELNKLPDYDPFSEGGGRLEVCIYDYRGRLISHEPVEHR